jgi:uncharacterized protein (DUF924 family)
MNQHNRSPSRIDPLLDFWFGPLTAGFSSAAQRQRWFAADPAFDQDVAHRFGDLLAEAAAGHLTAWLADARGRLAFIIVTDQFSRQIHRGSGSAFATDSLALRAARDGIEMGQDQKLELDERTFFYLPFEHSESRIDQHTSVALFSKLNDETPAEHQALTADTLRFARHHRDIVFEFGRFPHRNAILERASTDAEQQFLRRASRFGQ